ncbi:MAG: hydrogenase 2 operon protein HybA [Desulfobaccales bacterium]
MAVSRRQFLKLAAGAGLCAGAGLSPQVARARPPVPRLPEAVGILYDATLCIGCKACMSACKEFNGLPPEHTDPRAIWDDPLDLSAKTVNIVKLYTHGTGLAKDREQDGYSYIRRFCMHCVDPACTSACPVGALHKDPRTGVVKYNPDVCIGCRYCQIACPYNIPKFQWDSPFPRIVKCQMCDHLQARGSYPACCRFCPTGASLFGEVRELLKEARRRLALKEGEPTWFPLRRVDSGSHTFRSAPAYLPHIYGEKDGGGAQVLMLANVPFTKLGLPVLGEDSIASHSETVYHALYKGMLLPYLVLSGLVYLVYRHTSKKDLP